MISMAITKLQSNVKTEKTVKSGVWKERLTGAVVTAAALAIWIGIWWIAAIKIDISLILPTPLSVLKELIRIPFEKNAVLAVAGSIVRVFLGYFLGITVGAILAFLAFFFYPVKAFFAPFLKIVTAVPVASFILLCMLWMKNESTAVFIAFLMVLPIVYGNLLAGLENTDKNLLEATGIYGFSGAKKLIFLYIPSSLPYFGSACVTTVGLAFKAGVSAEIMCVTAKSIGYYIYNAQSWETEKMFAYTIAVVLLSIISELAVKSVARFATKAAGRCFGGATDGK